MYNDNDNWDNYDNIDNSKYVCSTGIKKEEYSRISAVHVEGGGHNTGVRLLAEENPRRVCQPL